MVTYILDGIGWLIIASPIWLSIVLRLYWKGWNSRRWIHLLSINAFPLVFMFAAYGPYGFALTATLASPLLLLGWVVSSLSLFGCGETDEVEAHRP